MVSWFLMGQCLSPQYTEEGKSGREVMRRVLNAKFELSSDIQVIISRNYYRPHRGLPGERGRFESSSHRWQLELWA